MKPNSQPGLHKALKDRAQLQQQHDYLVKSITEGLLGKLSLIGVNSQGVIARSFVTDVKATYVGAVAVRLSDTNTDTGMYFDFRGLTIYHTYDEVETAKHVADNEKQNQVVTPMTQPAQ